MPMDIGGRKPWQQAIADSANDTEDVVVFGGNISTFSRRHVKELQEIVSDPAHRQSDRKAALEKLQRWGDQGSKFAQTALKDLGLGSAAMTDAEFDRAVNNLRLDDKSRAKVKSFGRNFFRFTSSLSNPRTKEDALHLHDLAARSGPDIAASIVYGANDAAIEAINQAFTQVNPDYYLCDENYETLVDCLALQYLGVDSSQEDSETLMTNLFIDGHWTADNLQVAYDELNKAGLLKVAPGRAKPLDADDKQALSIAAAAIATDRDLDRVLNAYLKLSLGDDAPQSWRHVIGQAQYAGVLFSAVMFAWSHKRADYIPSEGAEAYLKQYLAGRFPTFPLLDAAWERAKQETNGRGIIPPEQQMVDDFQAHEDETLAEINRRYTVG